jgi:two-component system response regulator NreC
MAHIRILLADDHTLIRQGLRKLLEARPEWEVAVRLALELKPDVAILDIAMPRLNGIEATRQIIRRAPEIRVLILSMYADEGYITQVMQAGATGYLLKDCADADLTQALTAVARGKSYFSPTVAKAMLDEYVRHLAERGITDRYDALTEREREVFQLIAEGRNNKQIADLLYLSVSTVETHRARIMDKLDAHSAAELVLYAVRKGVIR